jgi:hypothetical protein
MIYRFFEISCYIFIKSGYEEKMMMGIWKELVKTQDMDYTNEVYIKYSFQNHKLLYCFPFVC